MSWTRIAVVSAIALTICAGPGREAEAADGGPTKWRLLTVPASPQASVLVRSNGVRVIARYDSFTLVEASGAAVKRLLAAGGEFRDDMRRVRIGGHTFDPAAATTYLSARTGEAPRMATKGGSGMVVVHFVGPLKPEWLEALMSTGVELVNYMPQNAQLVAGDSSALAALSKLVEGSGYVRAVVPYGPMFKLRAGIAKSGVAQVVISTAAGKAGASARTEIARLSSARGDQIPTGGTMQQRVTVDAGRITDLAELGGVVAIEPFVEPKLHDERSGIILAGQLNAGFQPVLGTGYSQFLLNHGFTNNSPVIVDVTDEGVDKGVVPVPAGSHPGFYRNGNPALPSRIVYAQEATLADADARDCGGHGTNVAGIIAGFNNQTGQTHEDAQGFNYGVGIQPFGQIGATKIFKCAGPFDVTTSVAALHASAYAAGARISNNSWGSDAGGAYNARSQEFDTLVRDAQPGTAGNQQFVEVVSAGNDGAGANTIGSPGTAKNVITVGASEGVRAIGANDGCFVSDLGSNSARDIINFSSRGPTDDGRIKPDVVAPGTHIVALQPQTGADYTGDFTCNPTFPAGSPLYNLVSGTSQAAPTVSGFASLIHTWYRANHGNNTTYPSPAMTKALMINTATDLAGGDAGNGKVLAHIPNNNQGWGRVNLGNLVDGTKRDVVDQTVVLKATGQSNTRFYTIADPAKPLRLTLVWTDAVGPTVGNSFVNDLDLEVSAGGYLYKGNFFNNGLSVKGGTADPINNVENVFLPAGIKGPVSVRVIGKNIAGDGLPGNTNSTDQDFALVVSNGERKTWLGVPEISAVRATPPAGDTVLGPRDNFQVRWKVKNVGNQSIAAFKAVLRAPAADATITQAASAYGAIAPNAIVSNSTLFGAKVGAGLACGKPLRLSLAGNANGVPFLLPFEVKTGKPGTPATVASTDVPKAIPDGSTTGVTSVRNIGGAGTVADMQVTIGSITHSFISDLTVDLTSPDGTTVRLFNRQGGLGDNMTNTVFSDAAATPISAGAAPFTGTFLPEEPLSAFDGKPITGNWTLTVKDNVTVYTGTLNSWSLTRTLYVCK